MQQSTGNYIGAVNYLINKSEIIEFTEANQNIVLLEHLNKDILKYFLIKGPRVLFSEKYNINSGSLEEIAAAIKNNVLVHFKVVDNTGTVRVFREEIDESQILFSYIKSKDNNCRHVIIPETWIENGHHKSINDALKRLIKIMR